LALRRFELTCSVEPPYQNGAKPTKTISPADAMHTSPKVRMPAARPWYERS
jgi:hypothetical protein